MRCAAFSAAKKRPLLEIDNQDDAISHFHDKLLKLKSMIRTPTGKELAFERHDSMLSFLNAMARESESVYGGDASKILGRS